MLHNAVLLMYNAASGSHGDDTLARKAISTSLLLFAVVGPLLYGLSFLSLGVALMRIETLRLIVMFLVVSLSIGAGAFLAASRGTAVFLRIAGAISVLAMMALLGWSWRVWATEFDQVLVDTAMEPIATNQVGILFAPLDDSATATDVIRQIEDTVNVVLSKNGLRSEVGFRRVYPISSFEQAERLATALNANIVVWQRQVSGVPIIHEWHISVMGADETLVDPDAESLLCFLLTQGDIVIQTSSDVENDSDMLLAVSEVTAGFAALAVGDPVLAASEFHYAYESELLPDSSKEAIQGYRGIALLSADRMDLAAEEFAALDTAYAWTGQACISMFDRDWNAARDNLECAVARDPYFAPAYCGLGIVSVRLLDIDSALNAYDEAIALEPNWGVPHALKAMAYELLGDSETAAAEYQLCVQLAGPNGALQREAAEFGTIVVENPPTAVPTATPKPTATPTPFPTSGVHIVESGDTVAGIADEYGVTIDDLVSVNNLEDPNSLSIGDILIIPDF